MSAILNVINRFARWTESIAFFETFFSIRYIENRAGFLQSDLKAIQKATAHS